MVKNPGHDAIVKGLKKAAKVAMDETKWRMNDAAKVVAGQIPEIIRERYTIKKSEVSARIEVLKATNQRPEAVIKVARIKREAGASTPPSMFSFTKPRKVKKGIEIQVIKGSKKILTGAFIRQIGGNDVLMIKKTKGQKAPYPTKGVHGPSPAEMLDEMGVKTDVLIRETLAKQADEIMKGILA